MAAPHAADTPGDAEELDLGGRYCDPSLEKSKQPPPNITDVPPDFRDLALRLAMFVRYMDTNWCRGQVVVEAIARLGYNFHAVENPHAVLHARMPEIMEEKPLKISFIAVLYNSGLRAKWRDWTRRGVFPKNHIFQFLRGQISKLGIDRKTLSGDAWFVLGLASLRDYWVWTLRDHGDESPVDVSTTTMAINLLRTARHTKPIWDELKDSQAQFQTLKAQFDTQATKLAAAQDTVTKLETDATTNATELTVAQRAVTQLKANAETDAKTNDAKLAAAQLEITKLTADAAANAAKLAATKDTVSQLNTDTTTNAETNAAELAAAKDTITRLEADAATNATKLAAAQHAADQLKVYATADATANAAKLAAALLKITQLEEHAMASQKEHQKLEKAQGEAQQAQRELTNIRTQLSTSATRIHSLQKLVQKLQAERNTMDALFMISVAKAHMQGHVQSEMPDATKTVFRQTALRSQLFGLISRLAKIEGLPPNEDLKNAMAPLHDLGIMNWSEAQEKALLAAAADVWQTLKVQAVSKSTNSNMDKAVPAFPTKPEAVTQALVDQFMAWEPVLKSWL